MSRFIKTKDGKVFDIHEYWSSKAFEIEPNEDYWVDEMLRKKGIDKKDCKVVSTIEELCDKFIGVEENGTPHIFAYECDLLDLIHNAERKLGVKVMGYGAIWTDKGLIYVAKMNEKGELELL